MSTPQQRVWFLTPSGSLPASGVVNGRAYGCAVGSVIQVTGSDGPALSGQGFLLLGMGGPTANRPKVGDVEFSQSILGQEYIDTSLGYTVKGTAAGTWVNPATGAAV
jgi:hypothetical protein